MFEKAHEVVAAARDCIGTPFRHQGRLKGVALDCAGLGIVVAKSVGINIKDFTGYPRQPFDGMLKKMFDEQVALGLMCEVAIDSMAAGDVLLMRISDAPQHVAIYVGVGRMVHAYRAIGKVAEQRIDENWKHKIVAVYRFLS